MLLHELEDILSPLSNPAYVCLQIQSITKDNLCRIECDRIKREHIIYQPAQFS